ncbi:MAG TPA: glycosyltransferase 87 family protein [Opitutaceae bacterium]|nr:glycosyltransferase 87 family protein [Opitutaceae bacterium]
MSSPSDPNPDRTPVSRPARPGEAGPESATARRWRWMAALALVPLVLCIAAMAHDPLWLVLGVDHVKPYFADVVAILAAGQARHAGLNVFAENPFDPFGRPHVYGPLWLISGRLGLTVRDAIWIGPIIGLAFIAASVVALGARNLRSFSASAVLLGSPGVLFALERANNDLIIVIMLLAAAWLLARRGWRPHTGGAALLVLAAALKMYPASAIPILAGSRRNRIALAVFSAAVLVCVVCWWDWRREYQEAIALAPQPTTIFAYGVYVSYLTWNSLFATRGWLILGAVLGAAVLVPPLIRRWRDLWDSVPPGGFQAHAFVVGALCWGACYVLASNYPYRLVLLILPAVLWISQLDHRRFGWLARLQIGGWSAVSWIAVIKHPLAFASVRPHPGSIPEWLTVLVGFEQVFVLILTVAMATAAAGWLLRNVWESVLTATNA